MDDADDLPEGPSKSQQKRDMQALQDLGAELVGLPEHQLATLELPEKLQDAIGLARRITSHSAAKRQRQYIGKLMRGVDPEPIRAALAQFKSTDKLSKARFQENERWRNRLIAEGDAALAEFLERRPEADRQHLRRLVREAAQEAAAGKPPRHSRELFRYIQSLS